MNEDYISYIKIGEEGEMFRLRDLLALYRQDLLDAIFPIGHILMSTALDTKAKVEEAYGGTWEAWGQGRVPVGVGTSDRAFGANETGGKSDAIIPSHTHSATFKGTAVTAHTHSVSGNTASAGAHHHTAVTGIKSYFRVGTSTMINHREIRAKDHEGADYTYITSNAGAHTHSINLTSGSGGGHTPAGSVSVGSVGETVTAKNLQPYITCYMWKRVA